MQEIDTLFTNAIVLTMDKNFNLYEPGYVAVNQGKITAVGFRGDIKEELKAKNIVDCGGKVLMPGLVNAHTHVPMTLLRGLADDLRLDVWLMGYMMPVEREFVSPDFVRLGTLLACAEMIQNGITSFADMYYFEEDVAKATADAGMRAVCSQTVLKFPTPDAISFEESLAAARDFITHWKGHPLITPSVAPHAPYTCTAEILQATAALAVEYDVPLHTHLAETALEVDNMRKNTGMPVIPYVRKQNLFDAKVLAAHCVHIDEGEMRTMLHHGAGIAHNPSSNLKLASGIAPVSKMLELGLNVGIGTDGPASNNDLDMFEEIRLANFIAKASTGDPRTVPAQQSLLMATRMGAQAMHISDQTGSIELGKCADLILLDIKPLHNIPRFQREPQNIYAQIVYASKSTDVRDVMINGIWKMRDRELIGLNLEHLIQQSQEYAKKIDIFLIKREESILSKLIAIGGAIEEESFEVQAKVQIPSRDSVLQALKSPEIQILYQRHYREYDTYFSFEDLEQGKLRFREDHFVDDKGNILKVRNRLTHIGIRSERTFPSKVLLSRSRYYAPANETLRFYKEYFKPYQEFEIDKDRLRFMVEYKGSEFYINLDYVHNPSMGNFLEVKSRTWTLKDAKNKSKLVSELIELLGSSPGEPLTDDYIHMVELRQ